MQATMVEASSMRSWGGDAGVGGVPAMVKTSLRREHQLEEELGNPIERQRGWDSRSKTPGFRFLDIAPPVGWDSLISARWSAGSRLKPGPGDKIPGFRDDIQESMGRYQIISLIISRNLVDSALRVLYIG